MSTSFIVNNTICARNDDKEYPDSAPQFQSVVSDISLYAGYVLGKDLRPVIWGVMLPKSHSNLIATKRSGHLPGWNPKRGDLVR